MNNILAIRALKDNYIWMLIDANRAWVVDPGDAAPVIDILKQRRLTISGILITHHHADHSAGIRELLHYAGSIPVLGSHKSPIQSINHFLKENDEIMCGSYRFTIIEIPGHTLDHIAYYGNNALFCGDTLFSAGCGKVFEGTSSQMYNSLLKIANLPNNTQIYCGHEYTLANLQFASEVEPHNAFIKDKITLVENIIHENRCTLPSTLEDEKKMNPFLRCEQVQVKSAVDSYCGTILLNSVDTFYHLRKWKNHFRQ